VGPFKTLDPEGDDKILSNKKGYSRHKGLSLNTQKKKRKQMTLGG